MDSDRYRWQDEFIARYHALNQENFTLVACPGSGKTRATLKLAKELIETGVADFLWIVCPTRQVKKQWWKAAGGLGLDIEWKWENGDGAFPADMSGAAVTYGAVSNQPDIHRYHVGRHRTLVIFDEIHHADEDAAWGAKSQEAFGLAARRIMLSGTPFRRRGVIPFVTYDPPDSEGREYVRADYEYAYDRAQQDFVCRSIYFPRTGGKVEWEWKEQSFSHVFDDNLPHGKASLRLRAAIAADADTINPVAEQLLRDADAKLSSVRAEGDSDAGGLVIAMGMDRTTGMRHANALADHMERLFGRRPPVVVGDDPGALKRIEAFEHGTERWLVSINMVSEGVDIPRMRVLAYLTNVQSELYFDQAAGRICRGTGDAFFFIPDDAQLRTYAQRLADLRKAALREMREPPVPPGPGGDNEGGSGFLSLGGTPEDAGVIFGSHRIDRAEYMEARQVLEGSGWPPPVPHEVIGKFVLAKRGEHQPGGTDADADDFGGLKSERKERLRRIQNSLVRSYCYRAGADFAVTNADLNNRVGISKLRHATEDQLIHRLKLAQEFGSD